VQLRILQAGQLAAVPYEADLRPGRSDSPGTVVACPMLGTRPWFAATDSLMTVKQSVFVRVDTKAPVLAAGLVRGSCASGSASRDA
jgi:hypothetical protein